MTRSTDWLPGNHTSLYHQAVKTWNYLLAPGNRDRMGFGANTPLGQWFDTIFVLVFNTYNSITSQWLDEATRTPMMTAEFLAAEKAFIAAYRQLYSAFLRTNPLVTDKDLVGMGLPEHPAGGGHPRHPAPTTFVEAYVVLIGVGIIDIHFFDKGSEKKGKPFGVQGAEMISAVLDTPPASRAELTQSSFDTHSPFRLTFDENQRGKLFYYCLRWENTTGEKGPWNEIQSVLIP